MKNMTAKLFSMTMAQLMPGSSFMSGVDWDNEEEVVQVRIWKEEDGTIEVRYDARLDGTIRAVTIPKLAYDLLPILATVHGIPVYTKLSEEAIHKAAIYTNSDGKMLYRIESK